MVLIDDPRISGFPYWTKLMQMPTAKYIYISIDGALLEFKFCWTIYVLFNFFGMCWCSFVANNRYNLRNAKTTVYNYKSNLNIFMT